ncbi:hypothetical protein B0H14DRAFT_3633096 [Mycena olivaceomarginata]|nr:hypothetical protein B0H14DRAFT_3633096 [Mycena olivaceomarginata]
MRAKAKKRRRRSSDAHVELTKPQKASKIAKVLDERRRGRGRQYRVRWVGGGFNDCSWLAGRKLKVDGADELSIWEKQKQLKASTFIRWSNILPGTLKILQPLNISGEKFSVNVSSVGEGGTDARQPRQTADGFPVASYLVIQKML